MMVAPSATEPAASRLSLVVCCHEAHAEQSSAETRRNGSSAGPCLSTSSGGFSAGVRPDDETMLSASAMKSNAFTTPVFSDQWREAALRTLIAT